MKNITSAILIFFLLIVFTANSNANSNKFRDELPELQRLTDLSIAIRRINKGLKYEAKGKDKKANKMYTEAIDFLFEANKNQDIDPSIFFYLGFAFQKLKDFENAEIYYQLGLAIDPINLNINKYLGALYVNLKKLKLANERLDVLKNCNCEEYLDLKNFISENKF